VVLADVNAARDLGKLQRFLIPIAEPEEMHHKNWMSKRK
jgi:hypothetical protein